MEPVRAHWQTTVQQAQEEGCVLFAPVVVLRSARPASSLAIKSPKQECFMITVSEIAKKELDAFFESHPEMNKTVRIYFAAGG